MSKQSEAKKQQAYVSKITPKTCSNCADFECDETPQFNYWTKVPLKPSQKNKRCGTGGFAVASTGCCMMHKPKVSNV